jgi:hypothetical protein
MIICSVCGNENDDLSIVCSSCKSFLQGRADALNLFETIWGLLESPRATFKRIVLAKHKNYSLFLSAMFGVCLMLDIAWFKSVAERFPSLLTILAAAALLGPLVGISVVWIASIVLVRVSKVFGGKASRRNLFATIAYATVPMAFALAFIVPIEIAVFGIDFFGANPPPMIIKPLEYTLLIGLKSVAAVWMVVLLIHGTMAANAFDGKKLLPVAISVIGLIGVAVVILRFVRI